MAMALNMAMTMAWYLWMLLDGHGHPDGEPDGLLPVDVEQPPVGVHGGPRVARAHQGDLPLQEAEQQGKCVFHKLQLNIG